MYFLGTTRGLTPLHPREYPDLASDGPEGWMDDWTIFYWGWWISWSPFVGMFIAEISRGRTIRQFINGERCKYILYIKRLQGAVNAAVRFIYGAGNCGLNCGLHFV